MVNFYIYYNIYIYTQTHTYIYKIAVNPKRYTGIDRYPKYIVPVAKSVPPPVRYWHPWYSYLTHPSIIHKKKQLSLSLSPGFQWTIPQACHEMYLSLSLSLSIYIYIYICMYILNSFFRYVFGNTIQNALKV